MSRSAPRFLRSTAFAVFSVLAVAVFPASAAEELPDVAFRHVLVAYRGAKDAVATRTKEEALALALKAAAEIAKPGADFAAVSHAYSDDKASDRFGGFMGIFEAGALDAGLEQSLRKLAIGQVSAVIESPFGLHVIQRMSLADGRPLLAKSRIAFVGAQFIFGSGEDPRGLRSKEKALSDAKTTVALLRGGTPFEALPKELGAQPFPRRVFLARTHKIGTILEAYKPLEDALVSVAEGAVTDPVVTPGGWIVARRLPYFRVHLQHLLVMHIQSIGVPATIRRTPEEARARAEEALSKLKKAPASWAQVVAEFSDDPASAVIGGSLGLREPGSLLPEVDAAVAKMPPVSISFVVESRAGFHIFRRTD